MISSLDKDCHISLGYGLPFLRKPERVNFLIHLSIGAENLSPLGSLIMIPLLLLPKVSFFARVMLTPKYKALSLFKFVIFVLDALTSRYRTSFRNLDTLSKIRLQSTADPLTPIIQSSAYRINESLLNFSSMATLDGVLWSILCSLIFSIIESDLALRFSILLYSGLREGADPIANSLARLSTNLSSS